MKKDAPLNRLDLVEVAGTRSSSDGDELHRQLRETIESKNARIVQLEGQINLLKDGYQIVEQGVRDESCAKEAQLQKDFRVREQRLRDRCSAKELRINELTTALLSRDGVICSLERRLEMVSQHAKQLEKHLANNQLAVKSLHDKTQELERTNLLSMQIQARKERHQTFFQGLRLVALCLVLGWVFGALGYYAHANKWCPRSRLCANLVPGASLHFDKRRHTPSPWWKLGIELDSEPWSME